MLTWAPVEQRSRNGQSNNVPIHQLDGALGTCLVALLEGHQPGFVDNHHSTKRHKSIQAPDHPSALPGMSVQLNESGEAPNSPRPTLPASVGASTSSP